jgi:inward rectifier potassium channel
MSNDVLPDQEVKIPVSDAGQLGEHDSNNAAGHTAPLDSSTAKPTARKVTMGRRTIITHGLPKLFWNDIFHYTMTARWPAFFVAVGVIFLLANGIFALLYGLAPAGIANNNPQGFWGNFFFSVETFATVGYGDMHPQTPLAHIIATIEIFTGMSFVALFTGIMFARFSRPRARILFADHPVVAPFNGKQTLIIRAANARQNVIVDASAKLRMLASETSLEGEFLRRLHDLRLLREQHPMFVIGWNLMHVIDEDSPLYGKTPADLERVGAAFVLTIDGIDETTSQLMQSRFSYAHDAIKWGHRYEDLLSTDESGVDHLNYTNFHKTRPVDSAGRYSGPADFNRPVTDDESDEGESTSV